MNVGLPYYIALFSLVAFVFLCKTNNAFNYYARAIVFHLLFLLVSTIIFPLIIWRPRNPANIRIAQYLLKWSLAKSVGMTYEKRNTEAFENLRDPAILLVNHQSNYDMAGIFNVAPYRATYLAKKELIYAGPFGISGWLCGMIFIDRLNPERSRKTMEYTVNVIKSRKAKVWVFPEGTRNMNGSLLSFKKGAFYLAVQAQVPIYPVVFSSYKYFMNPEKRIINPGKVIISALPPIPTTGMTEADVPALTNKVRELMLAEFHKISHEIQTEMKLRGKSLLNY